MRWLGNLALVVVAAAVPCIAMEAWLRLQAAPPDTPELFVRQASAVEWLGRPNASGLHSGVPVAFNELGVRDRSRAAKAPPGTARILALGDSVTFGMGVRFEHTYPAQTEQLLNAALARPVEVLNFGIPGYNTLHQLAQLRSLGLAFKPDVVLVGFLYNDVELSSRQQEALAAAPAAPSASAAFPRNVLSAINEGVRTLKQNSLFFAWLTPRLGLALRPLGFKNLGQVGEFRDQYAEGSPNWRRMREALLEMKALGAEHDFQLAVMVIPAMARFTEAGYPLRDYHRAVTAFCREHGIPVLDLLPAFWGRDGSSFWISPTDGHPDAEAHRIMAEALAPFLEPLVRKPIAH